ncbi:hypothetical protein U9M48_033859 [Paspalum notatum var. saurae]|uniref:Uncharacterized protein n=1 Tax=Paspalum notatum var. saurae TaxID=547442 RepID=A0AAQ3U9F9_PASNO
MGVEGSMVDAAVGWLVQSILGSLLTDKLEAWARDVGLAGDARRLEREMRGVEAVLAAARGRGFGAGNEALARSMEELRELLYDAEDVLDELDYYRLERQIQQGDAAADTSTNGSGASSASVASSTWPLVWNVRDSFTSWASKTIDFAMTHAGRKRKRGEEDPAEDIIVPLKNKRDMSRRLNEIASQLSIIGDSVQKALHLEGTYCIAAPKEGLVSIKAPTTSVPVEQKVYGRDIDRDKIVHLLIHGKSNDLQVLPVVGSGGIGKTTLARFVYRDQRITDHFDLQMWVCASNNFDEVRLTHEMLEHIDKGRQDFYKISSFNVLQELLIDNIRNKRFLLVVDDMWEDKDMNRWNRFLAPLKCSKVTGCMILATTRTPSVAKMIGTLSMLELEGLDDDDFWLLFKSCAFGDEYHMCHPNLHAIGKQVAKTLKGCPLAAQSVGALLRQDLTSEHWCRIQEEWTTLQKSGDSVLSVLKLSYDHLPFYLQRCFAYCSLFPEDYKFNGEKLVHSWISQSFVYGKGTSNNTIEETGRQYLDRLVDLGFFKKDGSHYIMHDLMHELAKMVASNECATIDGLKSNMFPPTIRHLSIMMYAYYKVQNDVSVDKFERELQKIRSLEKLRTLMFFGDGLYGCGILLKYCQTLRRDAKSLRYMRIHLSGVEIDALWASIKPFHIRCLEFSIGGINTCCSREKAFLGCTAFAEALPTFYHLQTLDASHINLVVPSRMSNLVNLRHLIAGEGTYSKIANLSKMTSLQELKGFRVQNCDGFDIGQLQSMNELVTLRISQLENVTSKEATGARLSDKERLENLHLSWNGSETSFEPISTVAEMVLEGLRPNKKIKHIQIRGFNGRFCPTWLMTNTSLTSLQSLHLENCSQWRIMQLETVTPLQTLKLIKMWNLTNVSVPSLEELVLIELPNVERCIGTYKKDLSSHLRILRIERCGKLKDFSLFQSYNCFNIEQKMWFPFLNKLTIKHCPQIMQWTIIPLQEMQSLEELELVDMPTVRQLTVPYLKKLILIQLPNLECCTSLNEEQLSYNIEVLQIVKCCKLIRFPVLQVSLSQDEEKECLSNTYELKVHDCPHLTVSCPLPPSAELPHRVSVSIRGVSAPPAMKMHKDWSSFTIESEELRVLDENVVAFSNLASTSNFNIVNCPNLVSVSFQAFTRLTSLERVEINDCPRLLSPRIMLDRSYNGNNTMCRPVPFAKYLTIKSSGMMEELLLPCVRTLELTVKDCWKITSGPFSCPIEEQSRHQSLLYISPTTTSARTTLMRDDRVLLKIPHPLYTFVKKLHISNCPGLVFCSSREGFSTFAFLEELTVTECPQLLMSVVLGNNIPQRCLLPASLNQFEATHLPPMLELYFVGNHTSLRRLTVWDSPRLESLKLFFCKKLEEIEIFNCTNLSALGGLPYLNYLKILKLERNPNLSIVTLEPSYHDQENCEDQTGGYTLYPRLEWLETDGLSLLTISLCKHITALQHLTLSSSRSHRRMTRLSEEQDGALQQFTSLKELRFLCFNDLLSLPAVLHCLSSLKKLEIGHCPSISRLPDEGLPIASMEELEIRGCSEELNKQCRLAATSKLRVIIDGEVVDDFMALVLPSKNLSLQACRFGRFRICRNSCTQRMLLIQCHSLSPSLIGATTNAVEAREHHFQKHDKLYALSLLVTKRLRLFCDHRSWKSLQMELMYKIRTFRRPAIGSNRLPFGRCCCISGLRLHPLRQSRDTSDSATTTHPWDLFESDTWAVETSMFSETVATRKIFLERKPSLDTVSLSSESKHFLPTSVSVRSARSARSACAAQMDVLGRIARAISDALLDPEKLPGALILCGVLEAAAALSLIFFRAPGGVFLDHGDKALVYVYYGILIAAVVFGLAEASVGFWVSGDPKGRRAVGVTVLFFSVPTLIAIAALGGFSSAPPK